MMLLDGHLVELHNLVNLLPRVLQDLQALLLQLNLHSLIQVFVLHSRAVQSCRSTLLSSSQIKSYTS